MSSFSDLSINQLQLALKTGEFSATEIANQTLDNIEKADPTVNAFTHVTRDLSLVWQQRYRSYAQKA